MTNEKNSEHNNPQEVHQVHHFHQAPEKNDAGKTFGILSMVFGGISIIFLALLTSPLSFIFGILALWKQKYLFGGIGIILGILGLLTSPMFWLLWAGLTSAL